ncbi:Mur ligase family protein [Allofustis seminis]|uniref:Mur ligase family protein n=1 Tax=Allofustis seminis TaxID=166939 RepID=UPI00036BE524|nr:Mur ligase family protein [Allofustis seminis]
MVYIALIIGKLIAFVGQLLGRGSSLPGKVALTIAPQLLKKFKQPDTVIFITGTNGKTTVTHYIAEIFAADHQRVITNAEGANMMQGIATQMIKYSPLNLDLSAFAIILEVDEGTLPPLMAQMTPTLLVMNNLFADQQDRFGSADDLMIYLNQMIPHLKKPRLLLNANDPRLVKIGNDHENNAPLYYGIEADDFGQPAHAANCPICQKQLTYSAHYYEHIGIFHCQNDHFHTPTAHYLATAVNLTTRAFAMDGITYPIPQDNIYTAYNALAAASAARFFNIEPHIIQSGLKKDFAIKGRMDRIIVNEHEIFANLAKNPAGFNQSIMAIKKQINEPFNLLLAINTRPADGTSAKWLNDCELHLLNINSLQHVYITGEAHEELKASLLAQGFKHQKITTLSADAALEALTHADEAAYLIANYTALYELYALLEK